MKANKLIAIFISCFVASVSVCFINYAAFGGNTDAWAACSVIGGCVLFFFASLSEHES